MLVGQGIALPELEDCGILPNSLLWKLDLFLEKIELFLARTEEKKAEVNLNHAQERLKELDCLGLTESLTAEIQALIKNKLGALLKSMEIENPAEAQNIKEKYNKNAFVGTGEDLPTLKFD